MKTFNEWLKLNEQIPPVPEEEFLIQVKSRVPPEEIAKNIKQKFQHEAGRRDVINRMKRKIKPWFSKADPTLARTIDDIEAQVLDPVAMHGPEAAGFSRAMSGRPEIY